MELLKQTKEICSIYNIKPARSRGQNFLINEETYDSILEASHLEQEDIVLEVGPGLGFLTAKLAAQAKKVIAVELDDKLSATLKLALATQKVDNVEVINKNILDFSPAMLDLKNNNYKIVANLPYNITSVFLRKFLSDRDKPASMVLMLQKEVAERIIAQPPKMSMLAISVQFYADAEIIKNVPANFFWPEPEVESAIIRLKIKKQKLKINEKDFFRLVKIGFSSRRKMLKNNLAGGYKISQDEAVNKIKKAGFCQKIRAQELSLEDWQKLFEEFRQNML